jgi:ethanolamine ammonia-lyase small subunit
MAYERDSWLALSGYTTARIALGRAGGSCRTETLLEFRAALARARDAVMKGFEIQTLEKDLQHAGFQTLLLETLAGTHSDALPRCRSADIPVRQSRRGGIGSTNGLRADETGQPLKVAADRNVRVPLELSALAGNRRIFLSRPDLGRLLCESSRCLLLEKKACWGPRDLAVIVSDGLSAQAAERHVAPTLAALLPHLRDAGWSLYPIFIVPFARVKLQDEIGELLGARQALMLLGERPGLGSPDSLGAYFTFAPRADRTDANRNCVSNIRPEGRPPDQAGEKIAMLLLESVRLRLSGIGLRDSGRSERQLKG